MIKITLELPDTTISGYMAITWKSKDGETLVTTLMLREDLPKDGTVIRIGESEE